MAANKKLELIASTKYAHLCDSPECQARIPARSSAVCLTKEEVIDGKKDIFHLYFCDINCFNDYEAAIMYGAAAACDIG